LLDKWKVEDIIIHGTPCLLWCVFLEQIKMEQTFLHNLFNKYLELLLTEEQIILGLIWDILHF
jgi:hypothetical protein